MSELFDRLKRVFDDGHGEPADGLISDERFARGTPRPAAVLIPVTDRPRPGVILTRRPDDLRSHPGQVAFPGGKIDFGETPVEAALREAEEELAMPRHAVRIVGATDNYVTGTGFDITPVLGLVAPDLPLVPNPGEVESWFEVPLAHLFDLANFDEQRVFWQGAERRYLEMHYRGYRIWGVTAGIIANLARRMQLAELFD